MVIYLGPSFYTYFYVKIVKTWFSEDFMARVIERSDRHLLEALRNGKQMTVEQLGEALAVTATAVRQRLERLIAAGAVTRQELRQGRGRPSYQYTLTDAGAELLGHNLADLARVMWSEIARIADRETRTQLLNRIGERMSEMYAAEVVGETNEERLQSLAECLRSREIGARVEQVAGQALPVLKITGCPYPGLSGPTHHEICEMEQSMFAGLLGHPIRLADCRCHSAEGVCTFELENATNELENAATK
jgi:DeoR family transcriptional regulator, suf operon transcriptional repressor